MGDCFDGLAGQLDESTEFCEDVIVWDKGDMRMLALPAPDNKGFELYLRVGFGLSEEQAAQWPEEHGIETLELSPRAYNRLKRSGIHTIERLMNTTDAELIGIRNFGDKLLDEVHVKLNAWLGINCQHEDITERGFQYDVTPQQVAKRMGISYAMVCKMLRDGVIKGTKVGGKWRISSQEMKRLAFKQRKHRHI